MIYRRLRGAWVRFMFWLCCRNFPPCPRCKSLNGTVSGFSGDNGKTHGYPDYAPPTIMHHYCLQCKHEWTTRYSQFHYRLPDWYHAIRTWPARFLSNKTYLRLLDEIDCPEDIEHA